MNNREGVVSPHNAENKKQEKQEKTKLTKYYMNVDKIRNLNVSNREKNKLNYQSSYFKNDDKLNRRSLILKKYEKSRKNLLLSL